MNYQIVQLTLRELRSLFADRRLWMAFGVIVALFVFTGPFGTIDRLGFAERLGFWLTVHFVTWSIALSGIAVVSVWNGGSSRIGLLQTVIGCCLATPFIGLAVGLLRTLFLNDAITTASVLWQMLQALPVAIIIGIVAYFFFQPVRSPASEVAPRDAQATLMLRLPPAKRGELLYMSMQDHYVEIVTSKGRELVLLRLADAINEAGTQNRYPGAPLALGRVFGHREHQARCRQDQPRHVRRHRTAGQPHLCDCVARGGHFLTRYFRVRSH